MFERCYIFLVEFMLGLGQPDMKMLWSDPFHWSSGWMLQVFVLLDDELTSRSQVFCSPDRFSSRIALCLAPPIFPSTLTSFPLLTEIKHSHIMMQPSPWITMKMECSGWWTVIFSALRVLYLDQSVWFWSHLNEAYVCCIPYMPCGKLQTGLLMAAFQLWLSQQVLPPVSASPPELPWTSRLLFRLTLLLPGLSV